MRLKKTLLIISSCLVLLSVKADNDNDFDIISKRIIEQINCPTDSALNIAIDLMTDEGSYSDIDYTSTANSGWKPKYHYYRLKDLAIAYVNPDNNYYKSDVVYTKILRGLQFWYDSHPKSDNWWHAKIEEPQYLGIILIAMRYGFKRIPENLESKIIARCKNMGANPADYLSSNRVNIALHWIYTACLTKDKHRLETALYFIWEPIKYTSGEGFQEDGSFHQHGHQLYLGAYAESNMEGILQMAVCTEGTFFELEDSKKDVLVRFVRGAYMQSIRGEGMHYNCMGRAIAYEGFIKRTEVRTSYFNRMAKIDHNNSDEYLLMIDKLNGKIKANEGVLSSHHHYYRSDYTTHVRPTYSFSVRFVSRRTDRCENGDGDNLLGYYLSDGSYCITTTGNEYYNIMPLWNWNMIPGITAPLLDSIPVTKAWDVQGTAELAGGVSDSIYGCTAYKYYDTYSGVNTGGCKGWFFFDNEIVCLGSNIKSDHQVITSIDQNWGGQYVIASIKGKQTQFGGIMEQTSINNPDWLFHNGVGYYFPLGAAVRVCNDIKTGNWHTFATSQKDEVISGKVFTAFIEHSDKVHSEEGDSYAYVIIPDTDKERLCNYAKDNQISIIANTDSVQAVLHKGLNCFEANFYKSCSVNFGGIRLEVSHPCCIIMKNVDGKTLLHIADPTQSKCEIVVSIKDNNGVNYSCTADFTSIGDIHSGKSIVLYLPVLYMPTIIETIKDNKLYNIKYDFGTKTYQFKSPKVLNGKIEIFTLDGKKISSSIVNNKNFDIPFPSKGLYLVKLVLNGNRYIEKLYYK